MSNPKGLTAIRVATWLATFTDSDVVGKTHDPMRCPLADCLRGINATDYASVAARVYAVGTGDYGQQVYRDTPIWARRFVALVDALNGRIAPVSAREAKDALLLATVGTRDHERVQQILGR